jgi:radical SAM superfamily enzyme YgiQ (UPF0313 family)
MRIALISPRVNFTTNIKDLEEFWYSSNEAVPYRKLWSGVSSALLIVAALTPSSYDVQFIDENEEEIDYSEEYDLVGISAMTQQIMRAYEIADNFRKRNVTVVMGGIHPTLLPEEAIQHSDSVAIGEAEYIWDKILIDIKNGQLKQYYKSDKVVNLNDSPTPRYDLLKKYNYHQICLQTSRGCPHDCDYCSASKIYGQRYRTKSVDRVISEIKIIKNIIGDPIYFISDDNLFVDENRSVQLLEEITLLNIRWHGQCDISIGKNDNLLKLIRKSGCSFLFIGLESITMEGLINIDREGWKYKQLRNYKSYIQNIQQNGIGVMGAFMIGLDSDDISVFDKIYLFIKENDLYAASVTIITPVPGTRLRERLKKERRLLETSWENYTGYNINFRPQKMTIREMEVGIVQLYQKIYQKDLFYKKMKYFKEIQKRLIRV